jgi:hypothetical protein
MARVETKVLKVHPDNEQSTIRAMEIFHWNLANSQHVKTKDSHLERRGEDLYQVTETEHFVNLTFTRDLDAPFASQVRALEAEYDRISASLPAIPEKSGLAWPIIICAFLALFYGLGILIGIFWIPSIMRKNKEVEAQLPEITAQREEMEKRQSQIVAECRRLRDAPAPAAAAVNPTAATADDDIASWDRTDKADEDSLQEYLLRHPTGRFRELAISKLTKMGVKPLGQQ